MVTSLRVAVVCGGPSAEADVSRRSAAGVVTALEHAGHQVTLHELDAKLADHLLDSNPDVVFPITHGSVGEDGCLQGLLEVVNVPYVGSDVLASALGASKPLAKQLWRTRGMPVAPDYIVTRGDDIARAAEQARILLGSAMVVKPAQGGSAINVHRVHRQQTQGALETAIEAVLATDRQALVEPLLTGLEVTCGVLEDVPGTPRALPPTLIVPNLADYYDFASKYAPGGSRHECPAPLPASVTARIEQLAVLAHTSISARDLSRVDFFVQGEPPQPSGITILEINTLPGMTATSLYPEAAAVAGVDFPMLCDRLVRVAQSRPRRPMPQVVLIPGGSGYPE
jgi:D-alanine-D-alanine ligase